jgi:hypothetical protein
MTGDSDYRFGAFELLVRRQLLLHANAPVRVGSRALAILTVLVEGGGDLVTKESTPGEGKSQAEITRSAKQAEELAR